MSMASSATTGMSDQRCHQRLQRYWSALRGQRPFPQENEFDPDEIRDIWDSCFMITLDAVTKRLGYRYSYLGKDLIEAYGDDVTSPEVRDVLLRASSMPMSEQINAVIETGAPVESESEFVNLKHVDIKYRTCMVPLGDAQGKVAHVIGCMRWRIY